MVILGGLGSIWGVVHRRGALSFVNTRLIPDVLDARAVQDFLSSLGLDFTVSQVSFGIFGFILVLMMVLRPEGLLPERRRKLELTEGVGADETVFEAAMSEQATTGQPLLAAEDIYKIFGGLVAVDGVDFSIPPKSIVSIIGPNGAGKTTFFNMLTGLYKPTAGRITFGGQDITGRRPDKIMALGVARTFQNIRLFSTMSAVENVMVGQHARMKAGLFGSILRPPGVRKEEREVREKAREILDYVGPAQVGVRPDLRRTWPTATSAASRSPARWPANRRCCCSTSPPPA